jgi:hypothetical protein
MRTTLSLEDDAIEAIHAYAKRHGLSLGKAASELVRRGARYQLGIRQVNGLPVFDVPEDFPTVTSKEVRELIA